MAQKRQSKAVYRRRRLVVGVLGLLLVAAIATGAFFGIRWLVVEQPWQNLPFVSQGSSEPEEEPDPIPTIYPTASPQPSATDGRTPTPTPEEPEECAAGALAVQALTDKGEYGADEDPKLSMRLTNEGSVDCVLNVGTSQQKFTVSSGSDEWWRSTDCQQDAADQWVVIAAGQTVETEQPITWDRTRSHADTCDGQARPGAIGGGATYALTVEIAGVTSDARTFILY